MDDELEAARERAKAAWSLIQADVVRLKEAVRSEVDHVKQLGPRSIFETHPLPVIGAVAGVGLILGLRGGRQKAAYRAIVRAGSDVVGGAVREIPAAIAKPEKSLRRRLIEALVLAVASKGAQLLAQVAQDRVQEHLGPLSRGQHPIPSSERSESRGEEPKALVYPRGNL